MPLQPQLGNLEIQFQLHSCYFLLRITDSTCQTMYPHFYCLVHCNGQLWDAMISIINCLYQLSILRHQLTVLQAKMFYINLLLAQNLDFTNLTSAEFCCYPILQLIKCVTGKGNQVKANSFHCIKHHLIHCAL